MTKRTWRGWSMTRKGNRPGEGEGSGAPGAPEGAVGAGGAQPGKKEAQGGPCHSLEKE